MDVNPDHLTRDQLGTLQDGASAMAIHSVGFDRASDAGVVYVRGRDLDHAQPIFNKDGHAMPAQCWFCPKGNAAGRLVSASCAL